MTWSIVGCVAVILAVLPTCCLSLNRLIIFCRSSLLVLPVILRNWLSFTHREKSSPEVVDLTPIACPHWDDPRIISRKSRVWIDWEKQRTLSPALMDMARRPRKAVTWGGWGRGKGWVVSENGRAGV